MNFEVALVPSLAELSVGDLVRAGITAIAQAGSFCEVRAIQGAAEALQTFQRSIGAARDAQNAAAEISLRAQRRMGEELAKVDLGQGKRTDLVVPNDQVDSRPTLSQIGITKDQSSRFQHLAAIPAETFDVAIEAHKATGEPVSAASVARTVDALEALSATSWHELVAKGSEEILRVAKGIVSERAAMRRAEVAAVKAAAPAPVVSGRYSCIVIDPPWDMRKIERAVRPAQVAFDYPTMTQDELRAFPVEDMAADACHLFCWTTQKFLPAALALLPAWGFQYVLMMVWHKPGGFQPIGLPQYNCEFAVYGRRGSPEFVDTKAFPACFTAPRREHSRKPDVFYDIIRRVTDGARIDVFSREAREGFAQFGNETSKFDGAA